MVMSTSFWVAPAIAAAILSLGSYGSGQTCPIVEPKDRVIFRNNDILTGKVVSVDSESVAFRNSAIDVRIPWTLIMTIEISDRMMTIPSNGSEGILTTFHKAEINHSERGPILTIETHEPVALSNEVSFRDQPCLQNTRRTTPSETEKPSAKTGTRWVLSSNAPLSVALGTTNQETLGGLSTLEFYEGKSNHSKLAVVGTHNRSWQADQPSVTTDTFDGFFQQGHSFGARDGGVYGKVEMFFNSALGMAREGSLGAGYYSSAKPLGPVQFNWLADLRYFNERLYGSHVDSAFVGSRFEGQLLYRKMDSVDKSKLKYLLTSRSWINPMWNNQNALRGFTTLNLTVPFKRSLCMSFSPIEENYMRNAPVGSKRNYFTSSVTLKVEHGSEPNQRCY
jgi:hypothetical protein